MKYRQYLRRLSGQHHSGLNTSFMGRPEATFGSISSLNGLDLQALAASGQLPAHNLATLQAADLGLSTPTKSPVTMHVVDQRNLFSFENPKFRYGAGQQQPLNNNIKQTNLLHGIPTNMEPKQLANLHQSSAHSFGGINNQVNCHGSQNGPLLIPMGQLQSRPQILNENNRNHVSRPTILPNGIGSGISTRNGLIDNVREAVYNVDFSMNHKSEFPGNGFAFGGSTGAGPTLTSKGVLQEDVNLEMKGSRGVLNPSYDIFNELNQRKTEDWGSQNVGLTYDASRHTNMQGSLDVSPSVSLQHSFSFNQKIEQNRNSQIGKGMFSAGEESRYRNGSNIGQQFNTFLGENSSTVKAERFPDVLFSEHFGEEDLMTALLKQQEGIGPAENEFSFDGDNLPV